MVSRKPAMARPRKPSPIEVAHAQFCESRRDPDHLLRWMAWVRLRALVECWEDPESAALAATSLLVDAEIWKRGFRPPQTLHEAMARARRRRSAGILRLRGGGI